MPVSRHSGNVAIHREYASRIQWLTLAALLIFALPAGMRAQSSTPASEPEERVRLLGIVADRVTGELVPAAAVSLFAFDAGEPVWSGESDRRGRFQAGTIILGAYRIEVEVLPFSHLSHLLVLSEAGVVDIRVEMVIVDYELAPIVTTARRQTKLEREGFYERRAVGLGHFVTWEDIAGPGPLRTSDVVRGIPGVRIIPGGGIEQSSIRLRGGCAPRFVIDGILLSNPVAIDDLLSTIDVEALEIYHHGSLPMRFSGITTCGVVMFWTRDPIAAEGKTLSWKRVVAALGIGVLALLGTR